MIAGDFIGVRRLAQQFRHFGWEVYTATTDDDLYLGLRRFRPQVVVFPELARDESGYLACAKVLQSQPHLRVIVVGTQRSPQRERLARFVGGVYATATDDLRQLLPEFTEC
jgi:DNA-binding response OmpR family regulator